MASLFDLIRVGAIEAPDRIFMAPSRTFNPRSRTDSYHG